MQQKAAAHPAGSWCPARRPFKVRRLFFIKRGQKIFWYRSFQQLPLIHLSQCPVNIILPVWAHTSPAWPVRTFLFTTFSQLRCCPRHANVPERRCCLPSWRLHGNVRWLSGQYADVYRWDQDPTNQSLTIRHICPFRVTALCTVASEYRSSILDFPCGTEEKLEPAFSLACTYQTVKLSCYFTVQPLFPLGIGKYLKKLIIPTNTNALCIIVPVLLVYCEPITKQMSPGVIM